MDGAAVDVQPEGGAEQEEQAELWTDHKNAAESEQLMFVCQRLKGKLEKRRKS